MIVAVTLNPAMDVFLHAQKLRLGVLNRVSRLSAQPGGKGINIGCTLHRLGRPVATTGFLGGPTGIELERQLREDGVTTNFVHIDGETRNNYIISDDLRRKQTQINEPGPLVSSEEVERLRETLSRLLGRAEMLVIAGSLPPGVNPDCCAALIALANERDVPVCIDMTEAALVPALVTKPYLVKPDLRTAHSFAGKSVLTAKSRLVLAKTLRDHSQVAIASVGFDFVLVSPEGAYEVQLPGADLASTVRIEDAFLAGVIDVLLRDGTLGEAAGWGMATALAAAAVRGGRFGSIEDVKRNLDKVEVSEVGN